MATGEDGFADGSPAADVTERCIMSEWGELFLLLRDLKFVCHVLQGWLSRTD